MTRRFADEPGSPTRCSQHTDLLIEIDISNRTATLAPAMHRAIEPYTPTPSLCVLADAIIFNRDGVRVAVVSNCQ